MNTEQKTQNRVKKTVAIGITDQGTVRLYDMTDGDITCVPVNMPFSFPESPWRLICDGRDTGGFSTLEEMAYYVLSTDKPDEIIILIGNAKYVARKVSD